MMNDKFTNRKVISRSLIFLVIAIFCYNSVYFKKLSEVRNQKSASFDFNNYADSLYYKGILKSNKTVDLDQLLTQIKSNPDSTFKTYGNRMGIGNSAFFMVKAAGKITKIVDGKLQIDPKNGENIWIDTKYIFGNAIRDASGLVKLTDFKTNADFNKVSEALNSIIREKVIPPLVQKLKIGDEINVVGALKLSKKETLDLEILPVELVMNDK
jgi:predicted lipoprotein